MRSWRALLGKTITTVVAVTALACAGCDDDTTSPARDLAVAADLAVIAEDLASPADLAVVIAGPDIAVACGEPQMQCCGSFGGTCNPLTSVCNAFGVCVACGVYPLACCPGSQCSVDQTCIADPNAGSFCLPCGHSGQPCCYLGPACVQPGTSCDVPDGGGGTCVP
ncbi:MAG: hypothetical protein JWN44_6860 [Myxococcales bacterium]|nr:hypothetical protein [Myxococcales bacterium]